MFRCVALAACLLTSAAQAAPSALRTLVSLTPVGLLLNFTRASPVKRCASPARRSGTQNSRSLARSDDGEVDVGLCDLVDVVGPGVQRDVQDHLDHLRIVVTGGLDRAQISFADMAALASDLYRKCHGGLSLCVVRAAVAVGGDLRVVELREVLAKVGVCGQAVTAAVDLGYGESDALARRRRQRALGQCSGQAEIALQRGRTVGHQAEQVRRDSELLLHSLEQRARGGRGSLDRGGRGYRDLGGRLGLGSNLSAESTVLGFMILD